MKKYVRHALWIALMAWLAYPVAGWCREPVGPERKPIGIEVTSNMLGYTLLPILANSLVKPSITAYEINIAGLWSFDRKHHAVGVDFSITRVNKLENHVNSVGDTKPAKRFEVGAWSIGPVYRFYLGGFSATSTLVLGARVPFKFISAEAEPTIGPVASHSFLMWQALAEIAYRFKIGPFTLTSGLFVGYRKVNTARTIRIGPYQYELDPNESTTKFLLSGLGFGAQISIGFAI